MVNYKKEARRIISRMNAGKEINYKGVDYLYYGMGLYGYSEDILLSGCDFTNGNNPLFKHLVPSVENIAKYLSFVNSQLVYI